MDIDVATGKADLKLNFITLTDNKVFECRVQIPGDDEGKLADTAKLVVLGNTFIFFQNEPFFLSTKSLITLNTHIHSFNCFFSSCSIYPHL